MKSSTLDYRTNVFKQFLKIAPLSHALWRSIEAISFNEVKYSHPVLDLGCGFGEFAGVVFDKIEVGVDINRTDLKLAAKGSKYSKTSWADARHLPFRASSFATVLSVSVLEHIINAEDVITEISRVLKRGGLFLFSVPTTQMYSNLLFPKLCDQIGLKAFGDWYIQKHRHVFRHVTIKSPVWWHKILRKNKFDILSSTGTISYQILQFHELFLITALPSQLGKIITGKRLIILTGLRQLLLPIFFDKYLYSDKDSNINIFIQARKR